MGMMRFRDCVEKANSDADPKRMELGNNNHPLTKSPHGNKIVGPASRARHFIARVPHSGAMHYRSHGADVDVYALGREECSLVSEYKSRKAGGGLSCITLANKIF
jgi:hypothetical protein